MALDRLPPELLAEVTSYLTTPEYGNLRLVCKALERDSFDEWSKEFFTTRQFSLQRFSLKALLAIANHAALAPVMRRLIICTDFVSQPMPHQHGQDAQRVLHYRKHQKYFDDQLHFQRNGLDRQMLSTAVSQLGNLNTVEVRNYESSFRGGRARDSTTWKSYGWAKFKNDTTMEPSLDDSQLGRCTEVFQKTLAAVSTSSRLLHTLVANFRSTGWGTRPVAMESSGFYIPEDQTTSYCNMLGSLDTLMLSISPHDQRLSMTTAQYQDLLLLPLLEEFLRKTTNLRHLRINWLPQVDVSHLFTELASKLSFPKMSTLELGLFSVNMKPLVDFIQQFQTLETVKFLRVYLMDESWANVLREMAKAMPKLRAVHLNLLNQNVQLSEPGAGVVGFRNAHVGFICNTNIEVKQFHNNTNIATSLVVADNFSFPAAIETAIETIIVDDEEFRRANGHNTELDTGSSDGTDTSDESVSALDDDDEHDGTDDDE